MLSLAGPLFYLMFANIAWLPERGNSLALEPLLLELSSAKPDYALESHRPPGDVRCLLLAAGFNSLNLFDLTQRHTSQYTPAIQIFCWVPLRPSTSQAVVWGLLVQRAKKLEDIHSVVSCAVLPVRIGGLDFHIEVLAIPEDVSRAIGVLAVDIRAIPQLDPVVQKPKFQASANTVIILLQDVLRQHQEPVKRGLNVKIVRPPISVHLPTRAECLANAVEPQLIRAPDKTP
ncbi:hypothetical protein GE09DRAFT_1243040, partial [Coniochaeta sp. 2T2.1]